MPKSYEKMRDKFAQGAKKDSPAWDKAQSKASAIFIAQGPNPKARSKRAKALKTK